MKYSHVYNFQISEFFVPALSHPIRHGASLLSFYEKVRAKLGENEMSKKR